MSVITRLPRLGLRNRGTRGGKRVFEDAKPPLTEDGIRALYRLADSLPPQEANEIYQRLDAHFSRYLPGGRTRPGTDPAATMPQGRHQQAAPRGNRPRPYATGQRPEPPRIHPLPEPLPPSLRVKRTILLTRLARMPLLTGGSPEEFAAYARRCSALTGTPSRFESPEAWLHHRPAPLALPQAGTSDAEYEGMQAVLYAPGPELPAMLRKLFGLEAHRPSAPIPAVAETEGAS